MFITSNFLLSSTIFSKFVVSVVVRNHFLLVSIFVCSDWNLKCLIVFRFMFHLFQQLTLKQYKVQLVLRLTWLAVAHYVSDRPVNRLGKAGHLADITCIVHYDAFSNFFVCLKWLDFWKLLWYCKKINFVPVNFWNKYKFSSKV